jgi:hypothetical protein
MMIKIVIKPFEDKFRTALRMEVKRAPTFNVLIMSIRLSMTLVFANLSKCAPEKLRTAKGEGRTVNFQTQVSYSSDNGTLQFARLKKELC